MLQQRSVPPYRIEHIGSLLRPPALLDALARSETKEIGDDELHALQDQAIIDIIGLQEKIGLPCVTDGEFRRTSYLKSFIENGFGIPIPPAGLTSGRTMQVDRRICWKPVHVAEFAFLKAHATRTPKVTLLGPCRMHWSSGRNNISRAIYPEMEEFWEDVVAASRSEIQALGAAGCSYIQIDETTLTRFGDPATRALVESHGDSFDDLLPLYLGVLNRVVADRPTGMTIGVHMCRGNSSNKGVMRRLDQGTYEPVAERMFNELDVDHFFLEYDTESAGGFEPLRFLPKQKGVVLGLVTTKQPELETADELLRRIDEAARYVDVSQLALSPQCGFFRGVSPDSLTIDQQVAKLSRIVEVADKVWGGQ